MEISANLAGILGIIVLFVLMLVVNMPVAFAFALTGFLGIFYLKGYEAAGGALAQTVWTYCNSYTLMALPLFMLMGEFANHSGIGDDLYEAAFKWLGRLPGGLAIATVWGCAGFAACTGSSTTGILAFGPIAYKPMMEKKYDRRLAIGTICSGATMGVIIPPSITFIVYASITQESTGRLFMAGVFPGILQATMYSIIILLIAGFGIWAGPPGGAYTWKEKVASLKGVWGALILVVLVLGGIYGGVFTPTEAAAVGAFGALIILIARRGFSRTHIWRPMIGALRTSCMVYALLIGSMVFGVFIGLTGLNFLLIDVIKSWNAAPLLIVGLFLVLYLFLGCIMPAMTVTLLTVPFLYPVFTNVLGLSGILFGVLIVVETELAAITPPVGINLFVIQSVFSGDEVPINDIYKAVTPFIAADVIRLVLLLLLPAISLWLPGMMFQGR